MLDLFGNEIIERAAGSPKIFTCLAASNHSGGGAPVRRLLCDRAKSRAGASCRRAVQ